MTEPILDPAYWRQRQEQARRTAEHHAIYRCSVEEWEKIATRHREVLANLVQPHDSILDAGCGWGRLLTLLPASWRGLYCGVDLSPDFVRRAETRHPGRRFVVAELTKLPALPLPSYDWCVLISMRPMIVRNCGVEVWETVERNLKEVSRKLLYLEYDVNDMGQVEPGDVE